MGALTQEQFLKYQERLGYSNEQMAELLGCSERYIRMLRNGDRILGKGLAMYLTEVTKKKW